MHIFRLNYTSNFQMQIDFFLIIPDHEKTTTINIMYFTYFSTFPRTVHFILAAITEICLNDKRWAPRAKFSPKNGWNKKGSLLRVP